MTEFVPTEIEINAEPVPANTAEQQLWRFAGQAGQIVTIEMNDVDFDAVLELMSADGTVLRTENSGGDEQIVGYFLPDEGEYLIRARAYSGEAGGDYSLSLAEVVPGEITIGDEPQSANTAEQSLWRFAGQPGQIVTIEMNDVDFDAVLELMSVDGDVLETEDSGGDEQITGYILPREGEYLIRARAYYSDSGGDYSLSLAETSAQEIEAGKPTESTTQDTALWSFDGQAGQLVTISLVDVEDVGFDPYLTLIAEDGEEIISNDDGGDGYDALIEDFMLPATGKYYIRTGRSGSSSLYELTVSVEESTQSISVGEPFIVTEPSLWVLDAEPWQVIHVRSVAPTGETPTMALIGPQGGILAAEAQAILTPIESEGAYTVVVQNVSTTGDEMLLTADVVAAPIETISMGAAVTANLAAGATHYWQFESLVDQTTAITMTSDFEAPVVELFGDGSHQINVGAAPSAREITLYSQPMTTTTHYVVVRTLSEEATGSYTLELDETDLAPIPQQCDMDDGNVDYGPIRVGSHVVMGRHRSVAGSDNWASEMAQFVGRVAEVTELRSPDGSGCPVVLVDIDSGEFYWRIRDMTFVSN